MGFLSLAFVASFVIQAIWRVELVDFLRIRSKLRAGRSALYKLSYNHKYGGKVNQVPPRADKFLWEYSFHFLWKAFT